MTSDSKGTTFDTSRVVGAELRVHHRRISLLGVERAFVTPHQPALRTPLVILATSTVLGIPAANIAAAYGLVNGSGGMAFGIVGLAFAWALYRLLWSEESHALVLRRNGHDEVVLRTRDAPMATRLLEEIRSQLSACAGSARTPPDPAPPPAGPGRGCAPPAQRSAAAAPSARD